MVVPRGAQIEDDGKTHLRASSAARGEARDLVADAAGGQAFLREGSGRRGTPGALHETPRAKCAGRLRLVARRGARADGRADRPWPRADARRDAAGAGSRQSPRRAHSLGRPRTPAEGAERGGTATNERTRWGVSLSRALSEFARAEGAAEWVKQPVAARARDQSPGAKRAKWKGPRTSNAGSPSPVASFGPSFPTTEYLHTSPGELVLARFGAVVEQETHDVLAWTDADAPFRFANTRARAHPGVSSTADGCLRCLLPLPPVSAASWAVPGAQPALDSPSQPGKIGRDTTQARAKLWDVVPSGGYTTTNPPAALRRRGHPDAHAQRRGPLLQALFRWPQQDAPAAGSLSSDVSFAASASGLPRVAARPLFCILSIRSTP
ncbi:hypothetical protein BDY21DRAFT_365721 [Lineolata rhizophorae]|uniref:Uncharacterized protein n=1 Tax=Lineolata rhizophorae TaxID=578093 RepID=A0A6A6NTK3_9PEZI|nr:hypothetical protein BDY21DRAFT_365721 [Lineolata rhizophorae]